jgi:hypothetical protein
MEAAFNMIIVKGLYHFLFNQFQMIIIMKCYTFNYLNLHNIKLYINQISLYIIFTPTSSYKFEIFYS